MSASTPRQRAFRFVVLLGIVSLFADVAYEGMRSSTGPFLAILGASGTVVGIVAGLGEFVGYGLRFVSGRWADRSHAYWPITILGYVVNLMAVPALALAGNWPTAAAFIILERTGKAIRNPARNAMLSHAAHELGGGRAFSLHNAIDQFGAIIGPLIMAGAVYLRGDYRLGFALLAVPAVLAVVVLVVARRQYPRPHDLEPVAKPISGRGLTRPYWIYVTGASLLAAGFVDFALMAYHIGKTGTLAAVAIPVLYSLANAVDIVAALGLGRAFDAWGPRILIPAVLLPVLSAPLVLLGNLPAIILGITLWGMGIGVQGSLFKAVIRDLVPMNRRATAFGTYEGIFGVAWFAGSALIGILYDANVRLAAAAAVALQVAALPFIYHVTARPASA